MKSSNTCRDCRVRLTWTLCRRACGLLAVFLTAVAAWGSAPQLSQYIHDEWGPEKGFLGGRINAICQSADGYLWIGTERGLVRFDGNTFTLIQRPLPDLPPIGAVRGLVSDAEGNLWIRPDGPRITVYRDGHFQDAAAALNLEESTFTAMSRDHSGRLIFSGPDNRTVRYSHKSLTTMVPPTIVPGTIISLAETRDGSMWMGTQDDGLFRQSNGRISFPITSLANRPVTALLPAEGGSLWIGTDDGIFFWDRETITPVPLPHMIGKLEVLCMMTDWYGNVWAGTSQGLIRIEGDHAAVLDHFVAHPTDPVRAIYQDRDGALWIGTTEGLERFREGIFHTFSTAEGLPSENNGPVYVDNQDRAWFAPLSGGLFWLQDGQIHRVQLAGLDKDIVYSISGTRDEIWVGRQSGGLTVLRESAGAAAFTAQTYTATGGLAQNSVYTVHCSRDGTVWAGTVSGGVSRYKDGKFTTFTTASGLPSNTINSIIEGKNGAMWFATSSGLGEFSDGRWSRFSLPEGLPSSNIRALYEDSGGVLWIATATALAYRSHGRIWVPQHLPESLSEQVLGIAEDNVGALWFTTSDHVLSVSRDRLLAGTIDESEIQSFGISDGLQGVEGVRRDRSLVVDRSGRVWVSLNRGLAVADPQQDLHNARSISVRIDSMIAGSDPVDLNGPLTIAPGIRNVIFNYASTNLSANDRIRYRYTLDGSGQGWSRALASRQVVFGNLTPGSYRFHVVASSAEGLWNGPETVVPFEISPQFWQTWWFRLACAIGAMLLAAAAYQLRVAQLTRQLNMRFQERLAERTRIAQDLHDTLLQGVLSASLQLDVAEDRLPANSPVKPMLQRVLQLMTQVTEEGRRALRGLRNAETDVPMLEHALSKLRQDFPIDDNIGYRVLVQGSSRPLKPLVRDDIWRIGREAVVNAVLHSGAASIEVDVEYLSRQLRVSVRDDGRGIDPKILQSGREGHWGLAGMRERSESIGATVKLRSRIGAGTEVELTVPGAIAFANGPSKRLPRWIARWVPGQNTKPNRQESNHE